MIHLLSKLLPLPFYPLGLCLCLTIAGIVLAALGRRKVAVTLLVVGVAELWFFSTSVAVHLLGRPLERQYERGEALPRCSTIVLLGGGEEAAPPTRTYDEISDAGDRILHAARLYRQGLAPRILASAGYISFLSENRRALSEVDSTLLVEVMGVDPAAIICEKEAKNTHDHGRLIRAMLQERGLPLDVILVTSAWHMPRAVAVMRKAGFTAHPAAIDFRTASPFVPKPFKFLPSAQKLAVSSDLIKEYCGLVAYRVLGWI